MTWLIRLYPPAWRRRYGRELAELIATQPQSFGMAIDLVVGAIDAWISPQSSTAGTAAETKGAGTMVSDMLRLRCAGHGPSVTPADTRKAVTVTIGGTLALTLAWMWGMSRYGSNPYLESLFLVSWIPPMLFGLRHTSLKGRPGRVQAVFIAGNTAIVTAIMLVATWINMRI